METIHELLWYLKPEGIEHIIRTFGMVGICIIIFAETGFFALLPGDSLLVLCGIFAGQLAADGQPVLPLWGLLTIVPACGVVGDQVGYWLGSMAGRSMYGWRELKVGPVPFFKPSWLRKTEDFYSRWGVFTIVAGRWVPIVRTFAPIVAGITKMPYARFIPFNILGAVTWVWSMVLAGYFLDAALKKAFNFELAKHIDKVAVVIILISVMPIVYTVWKEKRRSAEVRPFVQRKGDRRKSERRRN